MKLSHLAWISVLCAVLFVGPVRASQPETDCVIKDFVSDLTLNTDASLTIVEDLTVDCGTLEGKHGIFRVLPTKANRPKGAYSQTNIALGSITDREGRDYQNEESTDSFDHTVTWKIGDPNVTIKGVHFYRLRYSVENALYDDSGKTVFNWNLSGNFWQLPIDDFRATVHFPGGASADKITPSLYDGEFGSTQLGSTSGTWQTSVVGEAYVVKVAKTLPPGEGVTLVATLAPGIATIYQATFSQIYGVWFWLLLPLVAFVLCFSLWRRFGNDPSLSLPELVQYAPPMKLTPLELGLLENYGKIKPDYLTATIIDLAVRGFIRIEEVAKTGIFGKSDWQITLVKTPDKSVRPFEQKLIEELFGSVEMGQKTLLSEQKNKFYASMSSIEELGKEALTQYQVLDPESLKWRVLLSTIGLFMLFSSFHLGIFLSSLAGGLCWAASGLVLLIFGVLMPRRTEKGVRMLHELRGFRLYLSKAEKYRMEFYEKENIFERYLPYAIGFGLTAKWLGAFAKMYPAAQQSMPITAWYVGSAHAADFGSFSSAISNVSSQIGQTLGSTPGGSGGGGFSGGGGGGGGGGSW